MRIFKVIGVVIGAIWALLVISGLSAVRQAKLHNLPADMIAGKASYYLYFPLAVLVFVIGAWALSRYRPVRLLAYGIYTLAVLTLPCYLLFYTGGM